jgi:glucokinase
MKPSLDAGFDLGGTKLKHGLVDPQGRLVRHGQVASPGSMDELLSVLRELWERLRKDARGKIRSCGFGFAGFYSRRDRKILRSPNYPSLDGFPIAPALRKFIDVPFRIDNDANMAAYGEFKHGAARGARSLVLLTIGTGVGSGIILDGGLWQGTGGFAGEIGHITVNPEGKPCNCGSRGCLETEVSAPTIVRHYQDLTGRADVTDAKDVHRRAKSGDRAALESFRRCAVYLGIGMSIVINLLNPEKILLGGGVVSAGRILLDPAVEEARRRSIRGSFEGCRIEKAALGNKAGLIGAAAWAGLRAGGRD